MVGHSNADLSDEIDRVESGIFEGVEAEEQRRVIDDAERVMHLDPTNVTQRRWRENAYGALRRFRIRNEL